jgi:putative FmdB family regulatory protein
MVGATHRRAQGAPLKFGRGDWIRTSGLSVPNRALYHAEPRPVVSRYLPLGVWKVVRAASVPDTSLSRTEGGDCQRLSSPCLNLARRARRVYRDPMPIFEYRCRGCGHAFEQLVRTGDVPECPACHGRSLEQLLSQVAVSSDHTRSLSLGKARQAAKRVQRDKDVAQAEYEKKHREEGH